MSSQTTNYQLHKIDLTDAPPDITVLNQNWDKIDTELYQKVSTDTVLTAQTDLNNVTTPGRYYTGDNGTASTIKNCPTTKAFHMYVGKHAGVYQRIVEFTIDNPKVYFRNYYEYDKTWSSWIREVTSVDGGGLLADKTVYVSVAGSDTTGTGESGKPFATINKALDIIPKNLNGHTLLINVASGTYADRVYINDFYGGHIVFTVSGGTRPILQNGISISNCKARIYVDTLEAKSTTSDAAFYVQYSNCVIFTNCLANPTTSKTGTGFFVASMSRVLLLNCTVGNSEVAVLCNASEIYIDKVSGSGNNIGIHCTVGGRIGINNNSLGASVLVYTETGGRVYAGAQVNAPWY